MVSGSELFEDYHVGKSFCLYRNSNSDLVAGIALNSLLLYSIRRFTRKSFGAYKQLLTIFAAFDIFLCALHAVIKPKVVIVDTTFGVAGNIQDRRVTAFYCSCFTVPFALMNIHFLYRYWSIRRPHLIPLFSVKKFIALLTAFPLAQFTTWFILCFWGITGGGPEIGKEIVSAEYAIRYGKEMREGWLMMTWEQDDFQFQILVTLILFDVIMIVSFSIASTLGGLTFYHIRRAETISLQAHNLQLKLFIAVCAQTFVPLVFVYIPYFCVLNFPPLRLPIFFLDDACMLLTSCFPAWDAVIMLLLMKDYREGLLKMVKKKQPPQPTTIWKTTIMPTNMASIMPSAISMATMSTAHAEQASTMPSNV